MSRVIRVDRTQAEQMLDHAYRSFHETPAGRAVFKDLYAKAFTPDIDRRNPDASAALVQAGQQVLMHYAMKRIGTSLASMAEEEIEDVRRDKQAATAGAEGEADGLPEGDAVGPGRGAGGQAQGTKGGEGRDSSGRQGTQQQAEVRKER